MNRNFLFLLALPIVACSQPSGLTETDVPSNPLSGYAFLQAETQALQDDDFSNPGFLWLDKGAVLFNQKAKNGQSCSSCHSEKERPLAGAAARYPKYDIPSGTMINIEGRINLCRTKHQNEPEMPYETESLLALTTYVANLSKGSPVAGTISPEGKANFARGKTYFQTRRGQFNLSCAQCHDSNWGKQLRGDTTSQGHTNGFPTYRLEWQTLGSLHKRFQYCDMGVRAEPFPAGSQTYIDLEYYLTHRGKGLKIETPAIRR